MDLRNFDIILAKFEDIHYYIGRKYKKAVKAVQEKYNVDEIEGITDKDVNSLFSWGACLQYATLFYNLMDGEVTLVDCHDSNMNWHVLVKFRDKYYDVNGEYEFGENVRLREYDLPNEIEELYFNKYQTGYGNGEREFYLDEVCYELDKLVRKSMGITSEILIPYSYDEYKKKIEEPESKTPKR